MSLAAIKAGRAEVEVGIKDRLKAGLAKATARLKKFGAKANSIGRSFGLVGGSVVAPLLAASKSFAAQGDKLEKMSRQSGIAVEALSEIGFAAEQSGGDLQAFDTAVKGMQKNIRNLERGLSTSVASFDAIGVSLDDLEGKTPDEQFKVIADGLDKIEDPTKKAALALEIFGRQGRTLLPMLEGGRAGIEALQAEARRLGLTVSGDAAKSAADLTDRFNELRRVTKNAVFQLGGALAPSLGEVIKMMTPTLVGLGEFIKNNKTLFATLGVVAGLVLATGAIFLTLGTSANLLAYALTGVSSILGGIATGLGAVLSPIGLVTAAIGGGVFAFLRYTRAGQNVLNWFKSNFGQIGDIASNTFKGVSDAIKAGNLGLAAKIAFTGIKLAAVTVLESIVKLFGSSIDDLAKKLAELTKKIQQAFARVNKLRVQATNQTSNFIGRMFENLFVDKELQRKNEETARRLGLKAQKVDLASTLEEDNARRLKTANDKIAAADAIDTDKLAKNIKGAIDKDAIQKELEAYVAEAAAARKAFEDARLKPTTELAELDEVAEEVNATDQKFRTAGTFSGAAASQLGGVNGVEARIKESNKYLKTISREVTEGAGLAFV